MAAGAKIRPRATSMRNWTARFPEMSPEEVALNLDRNEQAIDLGLRVDALVATASETYKLGNLYGIVLRRFGLQCVKATEKRSGNAGAYKLQVTGLIANVMAGLTPAPSNLSKALGDIADGAFAIALPAFVRNQ